MKRPATLVALAAALALAGCGGGGSFPSASSVEGPLGKGASGVWIFRPAGKPKKVVIFFHGQGGPRETTPYYHRAWIDHLVAGGNEVIYPRYELDNSPTVLAPAVAGVRTAAERLEIGGSLPVVALGYSRGGALALEYAAVAVDKKVPVPDLVESVNPVPLGEQSRLVDLKPVRHRTLVALIVSDQDPGGPPGAKGLLDRLRRAGFPGTQLRIRFATSHGAFVADHLAPLRSSQGARAAYWTPTDQLLALTKQTG